MDHQASKRITRTFLNLTAIRSDGDVRRAPRSVDLALSSLARDACRPVAQLLTNQGVNCLNVSDNRLGALALTQLSLGVGAADGLLDLRLANVDATGGSPDPGRRDLTGLRNLAQALSQSGRIVHLDLSRNALGLEGLAVLSPVLSVHPGLQSLSLADCMLGNARSQAAEAFPVFLRAVGSMPSLTSLDLSRSHMGRSAALALRAAVGRHRTLTSLTLRDVDTMVSHSLALLEALRPNRVLWQLDLRGTLLHLTLAQAEELRLKLVGLQQSALERVQLSYLRGPQLATEEEMRGKATVRLDDPDPIYCEDLGLLPLNFPSFVDMPYAPPDPARGPSDLSSKAAPEPQLLQIEE